MNSIGVQIPSILPCRIYLHLKPFSRELSYPQVSSFCPQGSYISLERMQCIAFINVPNHLMGKKFSCKFIIFLASQEEFMRFQSEVLVFCQRKILMLLRFQLRDLAKILYFPVLRSSTSILVFESFLRWTEEHSLKRTAARGEEKLLLGNLQNAYNFYSIVWFNYHISSNVIKTNAACNDRLTLPVVS